MFILNNNSIVSYYELYAIERNAIADKYKQLKSTIPFLSSIEESGDLPSVTELLDGGMESVSAVCGWFFGSFEETPEQKGQKQLKQLVSDSLILDKKRQEIEDQITEINQEMKEYAASLDYQTKGKQLLKEAELKYLENHKQMLLNLQEQMEILPIATKGAVPILDMDWKMKIEAVNHLLEVLSKEKNFEFTDEAGLADQVANATVSMTQALGAAAVSIVENISASVVVEAVTNASQAVSDTTFHVIESLSSEIAKIFDGDKSDLERAQDKLEEENKKYASLLQEIEASGLTDERLLALERSLKQLTNYQASLDEKITSMQETLKGSLISLVQAHPYLAKTIVLTCALSFGTAVGGPVAGFACKAAVEKILDNCQPCDLRPETGAERLSSEIFQVAASYLLMGKRGAMTSAGAAIIKETAPSHVQKMMEAGAISYVANQHGLSLGTSISLGASAMLFLRHLSLFSSIKKDVQKGWAALKTQPLKAIPAFCIFVKDQVTCDLKGIVKAVKTGKTSEAVGRAATVVLAAFGIAYSVWSLPLAIFLFYMTNKVNALKYEGPAHLANPQFRAYVIEKYHEESKENGVLETLEKILTEENPDFAHFCSK